MREFSKSSYRKSKPEIRSGGRPRARPSFQQLQSAQRHTPYRSCLSVDHDGRVEAPRPVHSTRAPSVRSRQPSSRMKQSENRTPCCYSHLQRKGCGRPPKVLAVDEAIQMPPVLAWFIKGLYEPEFGNCDRKTKNRKVGSIHSPDRNSGFSPCREGGTLFLEHPEREVLVVFVFFLDQAYPTCEVLGSS
jgi:hypothetical protein